MARCTWDTLDVRTGLTLQCILDDSEPLHSHKLDWSPVRERMDQVFFCGCLRDVGHFVYAPGERSGNMGAPEGSPWKYLDSSDFREGVPRKQGNAALTHKDGWTVLSVHDFTIDKRPGSHATFAVPAVLKFAEMCKAVEKQWPNILERVGPIHDATT